MIPRHRLDPRLLRLAAAQHQVVSREQARAFGVSDRVIDRLRAEGLWRPLARGVYCLGEVDWHALAWAGSLLGGDRAVLGLHAAGFLQELIPRAPEPIEVFIGSARRVRQVGPWVFLRKDRLGSGSPTRTGPARTIVDLAETLDEDAVVALVTAGLSRGTTSVQQVMSVLDSCRRHRQRRLLTDLLGEVEEGAESPLEVRYARDVEKSHGLPKAIRQAKPAGTFRTDAWYQDFRVIVELDGRKYHRGLAASRDMSRDNLHRLRGTITLRYGWAHVVGNPCLVATEVASALSAHGWTGVIRPCRRCHRVTDR